MDFWWFPKWDKKSRIQKFELSYFTSNFNVHCSLFCNMINHLYGLLMYHKKILFSSEKGSKGGPNSGNVAYLEGIFNNTYTIGIVKQDKCPKYSGSTKLLFPAYYVVQQCTTSLFSTKISYTSIWDIQSIYGSYFHSVSDLGQMRPCAS